MSTIDTAIEAAAAAGGLGALVGIWRAVRRATRRFGELMDDWFGSPARPGVQRRAGVMERLQTTDEKIDRVIEHQTATDVRLGAIESSIGNAVIVPTPVQNGVTVTTHVGEQH